jgi:uncharacterized membrane protein (UPF0182 family)
MKPEILSLIRNLLQFAAGYAVSRGLTSDQSAAEIIGGIMAVLVVVAGYFAARKGAPAPIPAAKAPLVILAGLAACCVAGTACARFTTTQTDISYENGIPARQITTKAQAYTLIESKSTLASFKATQTDKTQSASVGSLAQESNATNATAAAGAFLGELIRAAAKP